MSNYIVDSADLTSVANAIRSKGGTCEGLVFPDDFVQAIHDIAASGGYLMTGHGDYVLSADTTSNVNIPATASSPVKIVLVVKDSVTEGVNQGYAWVRYYDTGYEEIQEAIPEKIQQMRVFNSNGNSAIYATPGGGAAMWVTGWDTAPTQITIVKYSYSYPTRADTYHWYIWGEAST